MISERVAEVIASAKEGASGRVSSLGCGCALEGDRKGKDVVLSCSSSNRQGRNPLREGRHVGSWVDRNEAELRSCATRTGGNHHPL